jgi:hypothetical protein
MMGAHVIKCGLAPVIIDLIEKDIVTCVALNGAGVIHDFEIAICGRTSEDVGSGLRDGSFGMARETGTLLNSAISRGVKGGAGTGRSIGEFIDRLSLGKERDLGPASKGRLARGRVI